MREQQGQLQVGGKGVGDRGVLTWPRYQARQLSMPQRPRPQGRDHLPWPCGAAAAPGAMLQRAVALYQLLAWTALRPAHPLTTVPVRPAWTSVDWRRRRALCPPPAPGAGVPVLPGGQPRLDRQAGQVGAQGRGRRRGMPALSPYGPTAVHPPCSPPVHSAPLPFLSSGPARPHERTTTLACCANTACRTTLRIDQQTYIGLDQASLLPYLACCSSIHCHPLLLQAGQAAQGRGGVGGGGGGHGGAGVGAAGGPGGVPGGGGGGGRGGRGGAGTQRRVEAFVCRYSGIQWAGLITGRDVRTSAKEAIEDRTRWGSRRLHVEAWRRAHASVAAWVLGVVHRSRSKGTLAGRFPCFRSYLRERQHQGGGGAVVLYRWLRCLTGGKGYALQRRHVAYCTCLHVLRLPVKLEHELADAHTVMCSA